jgi:hypothetical protein
MPYKDLEKRRSYDREYKRRLRSQKALTNDSQPPIRKAYICFKLPHLRLPGIPFVDGWFITDNPEEQTRIEESPWYGSAIFSWQVEP